MSDLPSTAIGAARLLPTTQTQIDVFSDQMIESVRQGETNPLEVLVILKAFEKATERILKEVRENYVKEADKYSEKSFELFGAKLEKAEVGTKYNYSICNDPVYNRRLAIATEANKLVKEREDFLKSLKDPLNIVDEETGELVKIIPPLKTSTESVKVSIR